jgi:hypothetical protein
VGLKFGRLLPHPLTLLGLLAVATGGGGEGKLREEAASRTYGGEIYYVDSFVGPTIVQFKDIF